MQTKFNFRGNYIIMCLFFSLTAAASEISFLEENNTYDETSQTMLVVGQKLLHNAEEAQAESVSLSLHSNRLRKSLSQLRRQLDVIPEGNGHQLIKDTISIIAGEVPLWQDQVSRLRNQALDQRMRALILLEKAYIQIWRPHIRLTDRIRSSKNNGPITGHNTNIRSVHPGKLNINSSAGKTNSNSDMSLEVPSLSGQNIPGELNLSSFKISRKLKVFAHVEPETETTLVPLNQIHEWRLLLSRLDGKPLSGAGIEIEGHMPGHVHGLPTQPRVTEEIDPGIYRVQGVKFQMSGWWVMTFNINTNDHEDSVTFNLRL
ncbi:FixH family protein [Microbulbifer sp. TYP-18]|uniref:FixH family protein n=1 Tax=Microbulbifer sp. TYP-18 TaxID=3230024 RepID=UPI0034C5BD56